MMQQESAGTARMLQSMVHDLHVQGQHTPPAAAADVDVRVVESLKKCMRIATMLALSSRAATEAFNREHQMLEDGVAHAKKCARLSQGAADAFQSEHVYMDNCWRYQSSFRPSF